jgi:dephospho-CoA kinase
MLRVGLTGGLGSGKSTVAAILREFGAHIIESDALGRQMMEPGQPVYDEIVRAFGSEVVDPDGRLNRPRLAQLAFQGGRLNDLNAIVHPAVISAQQHWMDEILADDPAAIAVVESALIFEVVRDARARGEKESARGPNGSTLAGAPGDRSSSPGWLADWRRRIDRMVVVTAPDEMKIARYAARISPPGTAREAAETDARQRLTHQIPDAEKAAMSDYVIDNKGDKESLRAQVVALWQRLQADSNNSSPNLSLE